MYSENSDGEHILLGTVGAGQFIREMGVVETRSRSATVRAASAVEAELLNPTEFLNQIANSPRAARELIQRLSQRLREADDRIVSDASTSSSMRRRTSPTLGGETVVQASQERVSWMLASRP